MEKWTTYHPAVFFLTFFSYAFFHAVRKTLSNVKSTLSDEWTPCNGIDNDIDDDDVNVNMTTMSPAYCFLGSTTWTRQGTTSFMRSHDEAEEFLGVVDASFLFAYALGLYVSGFIADRQDLRLVLSTGMVLTAVVVFIFGPVLEWIGSYSQPAYISLMVLNGLVQSTGWPCVVAVMGNWFGKGSRGLVMGLWSACQSLGNIIGALMVSAVVDYGYEYAFLLTSAVLFASGIVVFFGLVPTPHEVGLPLADEKADGDGIEMTTEYVVEQVIEDRTVLQQETNLANKTDRANDGAGLDSESMSENQSYIASYYVDSNHGQKSPSSFHTPAEATPVIDVPQLPAVRGTDLKNIETVTDLKTDFKNIETETDLNSIRTEADANNVESELTDQEKGNAPRLKAVSFLTALFLPGVIPYSLAYAFLKLVNYAFFFWLPFYLSEAYGWREATADQLSTWYDVGGIIGGTVAGFISDRFGKRAVVVVPMLVLGIPMLYVYGTVSAGGQMVVNAVMLSCTGFLIGGVSNLISAAIAADLGRQDALAGNSEALSTVTGIVDGSGSLGAAVGQVAVPYLQVGFGWRSVFYFFMAAVLVTIVCILPMLVGEVKLLVRDRWKRSVEART